MRRKFRKIKVGTGITQKDAWQPGDIVDEESKQAHQDLLERLEKTKGLLSERAKRAATELNGGTPPEPGTKNWDDPTITEKEKYAREIASKAEDMLAFLGMANWSLGTNLTEEDIQGVLVAAYSLGRLTREAEIKFEWEPDALRGRDNAETLRDVAAYHNRKRKEEAALIAAEWQEAANEIWTRRPNLTPTAVGELVAKEYGGNPDTIRRKIKRPAK